MLKKLVNPSESVKRLLASQSEGLNSAWQSLELVETYHRAVGTGTVFPIHFDGIERLTAWLKDAARMPETEIDRFDADIPEDKLAAFLVLQSAPEGMVHGVTLHAYSNAANCHEPFRTIAHRVHAWMVGDGDLRFNHAVQFRKIAERAGHLLPDVGSDEFFDTPGILQASWELASYRTCLSFHPDRFADEILGATLFELDNPIPRTLQMFSAGRNLLSGTRYADLRIGDLVEMRGNCLRAIEARLQCLAPQSANSVAVLQRVATGYLTSAFLQRRAVETACAALFAGYLSPAQEMCRLIERKGKHAEGFHAKVKLAGVPFDQLILEDPADFLTALAGSPWVRPRDVVRSRLIQLLEFEQPMFRIFSPSEVQTMKTWINALPPSVPRVRSRDDIAAVREQVLAQKVSDPTLPMQFDNARGDVDMLPRDAKAVTTLNRKNVRHLYHMLLNIEDYSSLDDAALDFVKIWLARAARNAKTDDTLEIPFEQYSHDAMRSWFETQGKAQALSYATMRTTEIDKSRQDVIEEAVFLCPMILIDGGWVQNWTRPGLVDSKVGALLYTIFADEIGNGSEELNHPNVYRTLMDQMAVSILDHRTLEFAESSLFEDDAFMVPTFWLAISYFPRRFLPETLGLNLAMELSGVGGAYMRARDELAHYGYSTLFVDLHNTIDNASTGHSAMAADSVIHHMDTIIRSGDINAVQRHWERVWTGYRALSIPRPTWKEFFSKPIYNQ